MDREGHIMDFREDIRQHILAVLPHEGRETTTLAARDASALLPLYFNWRGRFVPVRQRIVHKAPALITNPLASDPAYKPALEHIISAIEVGDDLKCYLSRGVEHGYHTSGEKHLDLLLNDWSIHHLHLSTTVKSNGFVQRTKHLLFAAFRRDDAYLIDILPHKDAWTKESLIRVIVQEWPDAGLVTRLQGVARLELPISEQERAGLRGAHVTTFVEIDGGVYVPLGGLTAAGTSVQHTMASNKLMRWVARIEAEIKQSPEIITDILENAGVTLPSELDLHFVFRDDGGYGVVEKNTGTLMRFSD